jgi:hypothetical protein
MTDRDRRRLRRILLGASLATACVVAAYFVVRERHHKIADVPLAECPYLRDVSEPITIVKGSDFAGSDNVWIGLTFHDARGVEKVITYIDYWPPIGDHPGYTRALLLGGRASSPGREELALVGLLGRWYAQDGEARDLWARVERRDPSLGRTGRGWDGLSEPQAGKVVAVRLMKTLEDRNSRRPALTEEDYPP